MAQFWKQALKEAQSSSRSRFRPMKTSRFSLFSFLAHLPIWLPSNCAATQHNTHSKGQRISHCCVRVCACACVRVRVCSQVVSRTIM